MELDLREEAEELTVAAINARLDEREQCAWCDGFLKPCGGHR